MNILHYFLGFPPYRSGGLTTYAIDLMMAQVEQGDKVCALWPGEMCLIKKKVQIINRCNFQGIINYELINPLPVPLDEGIIDCSAFMKSCNDSVYFDFFREIKPDIIHIHTLMGMHQEFIEATKQLNIKTVFTTHDYFGICPKVTLYKLGNACENDHMCFDCVQCNYSALSLKKIKMLQSPFYRLLKDSMIVKLLRKQHRKDFFVNDEKNVIDSMSKEKKANEYKRLREYYIHIFSQIDFFHFNSSVAESVYKKYVAPNKSKLITITHKNIKDNRSINKWAYEGKLRITLLASAKPYKGFKILVLALDEIWNSGNRNFELNLFGPVSEVRPYMNIKADGFSYEQLQDIFAETDVLVAPSVWYETFGFTVLEALSYGVPVIVSDNVGAKDIIGEGGLIVKANNVKSLRLAIESLNEELLNKLRKAILEKVPIKTWDQFVKENYILYSEVKKC